MRNLVVLLSAAAFLFAPCPSEAQVKKTIADELIEGYRRANRPAPLPLAMAIRAVR